jgi:hypothetical protein
MMVMYSPLLKRQQEYRYYNVTSRRRITVELGRKTSYKGYYGVRVRGLFENCD